MWCHVLLYMTSSLSRQVKPNPVLWLATRAGKIMLTCSLVITRSVSQEKSVFFPHITNSILTVTIAGYWHRFYSVFTYLDSAGWVIDTLLKNEADISSHLDLPLHQQPLLCTLLYGGPKTRELGGYTWKIGWGCTWPFSQNPVSDLHYN